MGIGLIADLAVGALAGGSQAWSRQDELLAALDVGAPPDILNRDGQAWGITAFSPVGLRRHGYRAFIEMLRANLANVGGLRIDHVMGLQRLWVIPEGAKSEEGAYLYYPFDDLLRIVCLEATRANALIIGEDLGTVPDGLRERLAQRNILGTRVLIFEQQHGRFPEPAHWSADATATSTTHDLPSLNGWFAGRDIDWRQRLGQSAQSADDDRRHRDWEQRTLREALAPLQGDSHDPLQAAAAYLGETPAPLVLLPLEDALGSDEQPNLPGPGDEHPNWRRRWPQPAAQLLDAPEVQQRLGRLDQARRRQRP
ncbi:MAG: 4-alpha-glucanotransferase [Pseudomonas citronellolis]|nr:MAG: 4-alpha-glucanotransferase [Pseudomonas citronellolis]